MDAKQIALKVVLDQLDEPDEIASVDDRLRIQKAIYLAQAAGIGLGYHYSWYIKGPYSTSLTQDYYQLKEALRAGDRSHDGLVLNSALSGVVPHVKNVLAKPDDVNLAVHQWYEALASLHFLIVASRKTLAQAKEFMGDVKPHLNEVLDRAIKHLQQSKMID